MLRTFQFRLRPNASQRAALEHILADSCETYNSALQGHRDAWKSEQIISRDPLCIKSLNPCSEVFTFRKNLTRNWPDKPCGASALLEFHRNAGLLSFDSEVWNDLFEKGSTFIAHNPPTPTWSIAHRLFSFGRVRNVASERFMKPFDNLSVRIADLNLEPMRRRFEHRGLLPIYSRFTDGYCYTPFPIEKPSNIGKSEFIGHAYKSSTACTSIQYAGGWAVPVNPRGTSQMCSDCGRTVEKTLAERKHVCPCGLTLGRDHNAALNIFALGMSALGPGPLERVQHSRELSI